MTDLIFDVVLEAVRFLLINSDANIDFPKPAQRADQCRDIILRLDALIKTRVGRPDDEPAK